MEQQDAIFESAAQSIRDFAILLTENYQKAVDPEVIAVWPVGCALVTSGTLAMARAFADLAPEVINALCADVLAYIGARIVELAEE